VSVPERTYSRGVPVGGLPLRTTSDGAPPHVPSDPIPGEGSGWWEQATSGGVVSAPAVRWVAGLRQGEPPGEVLQTRIDTTSERFQANREGNLELIAKLEEELEKARAGGGPSKVSRHRERGKLLVRERIELLLDRDSPFLELQPLIGWGGDYQVGASTVSGIGIVSGVECLVGGADPTIKGGAMNPYSVTKGLRGLEIARENRLPSINLTESAGADLRAQADIFVRGGRTFHDLTALSKAGIPTVSIVFGSSTAGGAYVPGMSDYTILIEERSKVFLGGPPLVKMATGEDAEEEELGGAEMHARVSGLGDYLAEDETDAIRLARQLVGHLNWRKQGYGPTLPAAEPIHDPEELLGIVSVDHKDPFDAREVIARVVDGSRFEEFKATYGTNLVTGWASIHGFPVGILGNNGVLFSEESEKGSQFIQLCNACDVPIVFLQNITGFMVGTEYERGGIIKDGAKLINAVTNSEVPHLTVMMGASYGAGNYGMSGRAYDPRFVFTYPSHHIAVMGPKQLAGVLSIVAEAAAKNRGEAWDEEKDRGIRNMVESQIEEQSNAFYATGQGWDDGIIDPRDTRTVLGIALSTVHNAPVRGTRSFGIFRM
jgi:acyl-CoA carboxylase subunit beta